MCYRLRGQLHCSQVAISLITSGDESMLLYRKAALAAGAAVVLSVAIGAGSASAATKGNCTPYLSLTPSRTVHGSTIPRGFSYTVKYAGSSSGWSPSGSLRITAALTVAGASKGSVTGTASSTSVTTPVGTSSSLLGQTVKVEVNAYGPAGHVDCSKTIS
jgi:hypothetical protein